MTSYLTSTQPAPHHHRLRPNNKVQQSNPSVSQQRRLDALPSASNTLPHLLWFLTILLSSFATFRLQSSPTSSPTSPTQQTPELWVAIWPGPAILSAVLLSRPSTLQQSKVYRKMINLPLALLLFVVAISIAVPEPFPFSTRTWLLTAASLIQPVLLKWGYDLLVKFQYG
ncbi:hypothetical protein HDU76_011769, partial [Blyttiomyces sp. JEL0837]